MLPPDNFQEDPTPAWPTAPRRPISASICYRWRAPAISAGSGLPEAVERLEATLAHHGRAGPASAATSTTGTTRATCVRSIPRYVSSVDSGNLAGHLIALANACREWRDQPFSAAQRARRDRRCPSSLRARSRCACATAVARRPSPGASSTTLSPRLPPLFGRFPHNPLASPRVSPTRPRSPECWPISHARSRSNAATEPVTTCCFGPRRPSVDRRAPSGSGRSRRDRRFGARASEFWKPPRARWHWPWSLASCSNHERQLLSIGFLAQEGKLDDSCYDLLASEARLASFIAIAKDDVPARHWFRLGRAVTPIAHGAALISWSGSMFEYLMPSLVMRAPVGSLIGQTSRLIVRAANRLRRGPAFALGYFGIGLQRPRPRFHLSVLEFRRSRHGFEARTR